MNLLGPARGRLKLVVLSCCNSAAEAATDRLRLLGLPEERTTPGVEPAPGRVSGLARRVAQELGCAVVATRYPAHAEFLTAFNRVFYERMLSGGRPAAVASTGALAAVLAGAPAGQPAASEGTAVAVPGDQGAGETRTGRATGRMTGFPRQPERFVGRDEIMTAATAALRTGSGTTAILLHGMPGIVLDNLEELLSPGGDWQDRRWEAIFGALSGHGGESRLVATSRFAPAPFIPGASEHLLTLPVGTLPRADMFFLAKQLPVGLGPWTRLAGQSRRLVVLARMERHLQVLAELSDVRERMRRLTDGDTSGELPGIVPSAVREQVLDNGP